MTTRYDIVSGRPGKDGKTSWVRIGVMFPAREGSGFSIKLDALPLPNDKGEVWLNCWEPKPRENPSVHGGAHGGSLKDQLDDDVPF
jgi:hypothetical protein